MSRIVIHPGSPSARQFDLKPGSNSLGRGPTNDLRIEDASVSTFHCQIIVTGDQAIVQDLASTNGTFVNDKPITRSELPAGQMFRLGAVPAVFETDHSSLPKTIGTPVAVRIVSQPSQRPASVPAAPIAAPVAAPLVIPAAAAAHFTPAAASPLPIATPPPPSRLVAGNHPCKFHPKTLARYLCEKCDRYYCDLCVTTRHGDGVAHTTCRHCGGECVQVTQQVMRHESPGFFAQFPDAFAYPLRGGGVMMILFGMFIFAMLKVGQLMLGVGNLRLLICGIVLIIFTGGYLFAFLQNILQSTGAEDREIPELPGISNVVEDILLPFARFLGLNILCFLPAIAVGVWAVRSHHPLGGQAIIIALLLGGAYYPMAFLAVAMHDSILTANPLLVIPSIFKVPLEYFVTLLAFGAFLGMQALGDWISKTAFPDSFSTQSMSQLFLMIAVRLLGAFLNFYLMIVAVRLLGTIFVTGKERLGWFSGR